MQKKNQNQQISLVELGGAPRLYYVDTTKLSTEGKCARVALYKYELTGVELHVTLWNEYNEWGAPSSGHVARHSGRSGRAPDRGTIVTV